MNAPERMTDEWLSAPWPLPKPLTEQEQSEAYQREAIASAQSEPEAGYEVEETK